MLLLPVSRFILCLHVHSLLQRAAKGGEEALKNADDTFDWVIRLMDSVLLQVDNAVDEGTKNVEKLKTPQFWSSQVSFPKALNSARRQQKKGV